MATRQDWLDAGLQILAEQGAPALTIERLTERLGLSKGSFYHHFKGMGGFKTALLAHFEVEGTVQFIDTVEQDAAAPPLVKLERLVELVVTDAHGPYLEIAMRAWALQDPEVRALQERVDRTRMDYLRTVWHQHCGDPEEAAQVARLIYMITIGAEQVIPPLPADDLRRLYELALHLAADHHPTETTPPRRRK